MTELERVLQQWRQADARPAPHQGEHQVRLWALEQAIEVARWAAVVVVAVERFAIAEQIEYGGEALADVAARLRAALEAKPP